MCPHHSLHFSLRHSRRLVLRTLTFPLFLCLSSHILFCSEHCPVTDLDAPTNSTGKGLALFSAAVAGVICLAGCYYCFGQKIREVSETAFITFLSS